MADAIEQVVLLDDAGARIGLADKRTVHSSATPLHLGFSCHVVRDDLVLVSRRSLAKRTWPGVWTNAFCGHPGPDESLVDAVRRRASHELGMTLGDVGLALPDFSYRAVDASGIVEHERCPVLVADAASPLRPRCDEVAETAWVEPARLAAAIALTPWAFSPWLVAQARLLPLYAGVAETDAEDAA